MIDKGPFKIKDFVEPIGCKQLEEALQIGPVTALVDASKWLPYHSGIF
jgi:hypothetical protein